MSVTKYDKAWKLLEATGWCQGHYAKNDKGEGTFSADEKACSFCAVGALGHIYSGKNYSEAFSKIFNALNKSEKQHIFVSEWNDDPARTKEEVVNLLKELDI
jgi:hypothetical protein